MTLEVIRPIHSWFGGTDHCADVFIVLTVAIGIGKGFSSLCQFGGPFCRWAINPVALGGKSVFCPSLSEAWIGPSELHFPTALIS